MTLSKLANQHVAVVRTDVIDALCKYFQCDVGDLMQYVEDDSEQLGASNAETAPDA